MARLQRRVAVLLQVHAVQKSATFVKYVKVFNAAQTVRVIILQNIFLAQTASGKKKALLLKLLKNFLVLKLTKLLNP